MIDFKIPSDEEFLSESERFLELCKHHCTCADGWHFIWSAYKASGRRRSVYFQQAALKQLLAPTAASVRRVLIAGAADSGILAVLSSIFGSSVEYVAFDICDAPLREIECFAAAHGLAVRCFRSSLQDFVATERFDLVFVHNTTCFLTKSEAVRALKELRLSLAEGGWLAWGMRFEMGAFAFGGESAMGVEDELRQMTAETYAHRPDLQGLVAARIGPYSARRVSRQLPRYVPADVPDLLEAAALVRVDGYTDTQTPSAVASSTAKHSLIRADVHLLKSAISPPAGPESGQ